MTKSSFVLPPFKNQTPLSWYELASQTEGFIYDDAQKQAIEKLDVLWHQLMTFKSKRNQFFGRSLRSPEVPKGFYFWGGVGRGKSFLMDAFFGCLPYKRKRRVHFHAFMAEVHERLRQHKSQVNPLDAVAADIAKEVRLLCFDEFHVSDIADAMILGRLLEALFAKGVVLVATSNYAPDDLYPNGLQRSNFLPTIKLIKDALIVSNMDGGQDYRLRTLTKAPIFLVPNNAENEQKLQNLFSELTATNAVLPNEMTILGRPLTAKAHAEEVIWFDFPMLCEGARSQADYLFLAERYRTALVSGIPKLAAERRNEARRFTWLVDVFYDYKVKFLASSEVEPEQIYTAGDFSNEFFRTASRLIEMQTVEYLALPHLTLDRVDVSKNENL